ncbi:hypothetical protein RND81_14G160900 [Saponaria officinalis]|uniref:Uncharacterized protein n=1 Tax=Saponaria officinalis TaxID=3572 RepID=A0AAW1GMJ3_SAPOF
MIKNNPREWSDLLQDTLWAYRTSKRDAIDCTTYELVYRHEAIIPAEINVRTIRVDKQDGMTSDACQEAMSIMNLDLEAKREQALTSLVKQKKLTAESCNKRVRSKSFQLNDLVWKVKLPTGHKDYLYGKWTPQWEATFRIIKVYSGNSYGLQHMNGNIIKTNIKGKFIKAYHPTIWEKYAQNIQKSFPEFWKTMQK